MVIRHFKIKRNNPSVKFIQLTPDTARVLKKKLYMMQGQKCPILRKKVKVRDTVLDHRHKLKRQKPGPLGRGLVRGCLHFQVNSFEGVVLKKYKRYGLESMIELPDLLRNLADYLENPTCQQCYIYPSEKPKAPIFTMTQYKRIVKYYKIIFPRSKKIPAYPPSGIKKVGKPKKGEKQKYKYTAKLSSKWQKLLDVANLIHSKNSGGTR